MSSSIVGQLDWVGDQTPHPHSPRSTRETDRLFPLVRHRGKAVVRRERRCSLDSRRAPGELHGQIRDPVGEEPVDDSKTQREQRLAVALRANLHRRKQQARQRAESDAPRDDAPQDPADTGSAAPDAGGSRGKT
jgi:hypothetical protein